MRNGAPRPLSVMDMFRIGVGPSSSHTVGPMRAGRHFASLLAGTGAITRIRVELCGSLGATGRGHWTDRAVLVGLAGYRPDAVPSEVVDHLMDEAQADGKITVAGVGEVPFDGPSDVVFSPRTLLPHHVNGLKLAAFTDAGPVLEKVYYSVGGGFVVMETPDGVMEISDDDAEGTHPPAPCPYPFSSGDELLAVCKETGLRISEVMAANEASGRGEREVAAYIDRVVEAMEDCIANGLATEGTLPGGLRVRRRASELYRALREREKDTDDALAGMDWVNLWALAVNEENAAGHRVVTAPTNGAAGVVPAVLTYYKEMVKGADREGVHRFFLAATAVGGLIKTRASIAGAEVGCQGEVGSAAAMAAAGLAEAMGGTPEQVENAAEIAMEHNLGLTCDPVGGLVQIPCIERNAIAAVKAINGARMSLWGDGMHLVSLDTVVETMRQTGMDMLSKYKETSEGGLAVNVVEC